jgi:hypothetical protein
MTLSKKSAAEYFLRNWLKRLNLYLQRVCQETVKYGLLVLRRMSGCAQSEREGCFKQLSYHGRKWDRTTLIWRLKKISVSWRCFVSNLYPLKVIDDYTVRNHGGTSYITCVLFPRNKRVFTDYRRYQHYPYYTQDINIESESGEMLRSNSFNAVLGERVGTRDVRVRLVWMARGVRVCSARLACFCSVCGNPFIHTPVMQRLQWYPFTPQHPSPISHPSVPTPILRSIYSE